MATVYAVASAKGGVGKTTTTAAIATILADAGADVVAVDADIGMANLAETVGVEPGQTTLHDVLAGGGDPLDAVRTGSTGLRVVPGAADLDAYAAADPSGLREVVAAFDDADYVFLDAGAGLSHDSTLPLGLADETLLVSTAERSALGDTEKTRQLTERLGGAVAGAAITRVGTDSATDDEIARVLDAPVLGRIPDDPAVSRAVTANEPLVTFAPDAPASRAYRDLAQTLTGTEIPEPRPAAAAESEPADPTNATPTAGDDREGDSAEGSQKGGDDIIVADAEAGGLGEPGDEREIIVADESSVSADEGDDPDAGEPSGSGSDDDAIDDLAGDTRTVGDDHVDGDDLESMIEDEADETAFGSDRDVDDELAGSIPFRDDDTGTMNTVLSERSGFGDREGQQDPANDDETADRETSGAEETDETEGDKKNTGDAEATSGKKDAGDKENTSETDDEDDEDGDGFFGRLFGR